jgi:hypothetical protein
LVLSLTGVSSDSALAHSRGRGRNPSIVGHVWAGAEGAAEVAGHLD